VLLAQLELRGLVGSRDGGRTSWQARRQPMVPGVWILATAALGSALLILGAYGITSRVRAGRAARTTELVVTVERMHASGRTEQLRAAELELARLFELDATSPRVEDLWLENRALAALWYPETPIGVGDALRRVEGREPHPPPSALGRLIERFGAGDVAGARLLIPELDGAAGRIAPYQFAAGVVLEHAGDAGATVRYRRAVELDPEFAPAQVMLVRLALLERGAKPGRSAAPTLGPKLDEHPIGRCLRRLQWALDPSRDREPPLPPLAADELALLPRPLRPIPHLVDAVQAIGRQERERAVEQLEAGLALAETPAAITRFGFVALQAGDSGLAKRAALRVHDIAPGYPRLSLLASRIGLLEGRFGSAEEAVTVADATRQSLAVVHAVASYELVDDRGIELATDALGSTLGTDPELRAASLFLSVVRGEHYPESDQLEDLAVPSVLWGELLAVDSALDSGKLDLGRTLVRGWGERVRGLAPFSVRVARLARYTKDPQRAAEYASRALTYSDPSPRSLVEAVLARLALNQPQLARGILDEHPTALGPYHSWLDVLVTQSEKTVANARLKSSRLPLPRTDASLALWVLTASALVTSGDPRAREVVDRLISEHPGHPELVAALRTLDE
jgi:hypothetical protein